MPRSRPQKAQAACDLLIRPKRRCYWQAVVVLLLLYATNTVSAQTVPQIAEKALAATVYLEMQDKSGKTLGIGSGFFVQPNLIATNYHVIEGAAKGTAKLVGKYTTYDIEGFTATDRDNDLALLKVTASGIKPLSLGDSDTVQIGETVYVAGNPKGLEGTFSDGIISSRRDTYTKERLQMTAPISPGSSGGPVLNRKGEVIGVSFARHRAIDAENLNFAIPSKYLKALLEQSKLAKPLSQEKQFVSADTYVLWGNAKYDLGDYAGAIADYTMAIRLKPDYAMAYNNRGNVRAALGQHFAAITDYDTAIRLKPDYADAYNNRGLTKAALGQHFAAITDYDTAIRLKPDDAKAYVNRGNVKAELEQYFAAIADYDTAIRLKPDDVIAYFNRGLTKHRGLGQYFAAIADYDTAIRLKPDDAKTYLSRGLAKSRLERYFAAIADYGTAIRLKPDYVSAYYSRGLAKAELGQHFAAITDYDTAIRLKSDDAKAYVNRGTVKALLGRTWEAKQDYQKALKLAEHVNDERLKTEIKRGLRLLE